MSPGPTRIGKLGNHITLPRTVPLITLFASSAGAVAMLLLMLIFTRSPSSLVMAIVAGGGLGWVSVSFSPMKGESLAKWIGLKMLASRDRMDINGESARVHIGIAPVTRVAVGKFMVEPGALDVRPGTVDEHGRFADVNDHIPTPLFDMDADTAKELS